MLVHARVDRILNILGKGVGRHSDNGDRAAVRAFGHLPDCPCRIVAIHPRHHNIHQDQIKRSGWIRGKQLDSLHAAHRARHLHALLLQQHFRDLCVEVVVLSHQHADTLQAHLCRRLVRYAWTDAVRQLQRDLHSESRADTLPALQCDRAAHQLHITLCDRHTEAGALILRPRTGVRQTSSFRSRSIRKPFAIFSTESVTVVISTGTGL